jgi:glycosyltransferase involved in cell wall biosynthesis
MKVLHLTNKPIFPVVDGGCVAMYRFLQTMLHLGYEVKNITVETPKHPFDPSAYPERLSQIIRPESFFIDTTVRAKAALFSLFRKSSYNVERFYDAGFEAMLIQELEKQRYGLIVLESAYLLPYVDCIRTHSEAQIIVRAHNVEYQIWERLAVAEIGILKRWFLKRLARDLKQFEISALATVDGIACISATDEALFRQLGVKTPTTVIPVSMELPQSQEVDHTQTDFFYLASMNWRPNVEAVDWLIREIFPQILQKLPQARLHLAGSFMPDKLLKSSFPNVTVHGHVADPQAFMAQHGILLSPLRSGSGVRIKILEALALGIPVISTATGVEGIPVQHGISYLNAETAEAFAEAAAALSPDITKRAELGRNAQELIATTYGPEPIAHQFLAFLERL